MSAELEFKQLIDRILRCREAEDEAKQDTKEIYAELKSRGYDKTAAGALVAEIRKKDKNPDQFEERNAILDTYREAYHRASHAHTREARISTGEITEPGNQSEQPCTATGPSEEAGASSDETPATNPVANVGEGATGTIAFASDDPASRDADGADRQQPAASGFTGEGDGRDVEASGGAASVTTFSPSPEPVSFQVKADRAGEVVSSPTSPATFSKTIRDYRPHCQHPENCGGSGLKHCYGCLKARDEAIIAQEAAA